MATQTKVGTLGRGWQAGSDILLSLLLGDVVYAVSACVCRKPFGCYSPVVGRDGDKSSVRRIIGV